MRAFTLTAISMVFLLSFALPTHGQSREELDSQIEKLKSEITRLQTQLNATSKEKQTLQGAIKDLDLNIQKLQKSITLTQSQIVQKDKEINTLSGDITVTGGKIGDSQEQVANALRQLMVMDQESGALMLLGGKTLSSMFDEVTTLTSVRQELQNRITDLSALKGNLEVSKTSAEDKRKELAGLQRRLSQEKQGLTIARSEQGKLLAETQNKESSYQALIAQKQAEQATFERALFDLASGLSGERGSIPSAGSRILRWPVDNVFVTQQFGKTVDSVRLYASGSHDGIDLRATIGTPVKSALSGTVQEINQGAVAYCQYGKWVLVRHDNGLSTLYAHLSNISVQKGERVSTGEVVGYAGNTGYATGPHLHFTVYAGNAVSFKQYTCKSGYTVTIPIAPINSYLNPLSYLPI